MDGALELPAHTYDQTLTDFLEIMFSSVVLPFSFCVILNCDLFFIFPHVLCLDLVFFSFRAGGNDICLTGPIVPHGCS